ncbi:MAG: cytoplasmic protein, partial [Anaerolineaceae bacterium]|nr:cytoplasmic protein [Anaerolineaceae bacterium]
PILNGIPKEMPFILGYNRTIAKPAADVLVANGSDPLIAAWSYGKGRTVAYATDCAPHWAPPAMYEWEYYPTLWKNITDWLAGRI